MSLTGRWGLLKPPPTTKPDWQHPLARGLVRAFAVNEGQGILLRDSATGVLATGANAPTWTTGVHGWAMAFTGTTQYVDLGGADALLAGAETLGLTIVVGSRKRDATLRDSNPFAAEGERCQAHLPYTDGTVYWDFGGATEGTSRLSVGGLTIADNLWVFTTGPRGMEIWQDGNLRGSNSGNATRATGSAADRLTIGGPAFNTTDLVDMWLFLLYKRQLLPAEIRQLSAEPYDLWTPPLWRQWALGADPGSAPAGYIPRLALIGVG